jgi:hypothetical protein
MNTIEKLKKELSKVDAEIAMKNSNDGWWNLYMEERKKTLEKLIEELDKK